MPAPEIRPRVGFTGTRDGPTPLSRSAFLKKIMELRPRQFTHGACTGWDAEATKIVHQMFADCFIVARPGKIAYAAPGTENQFLSQESLAISNRVYPPKSHLSRNRDIVDCDSDIVIGCPPAVMRLLKGGTWFTVDYTHKQGVELFIICPDGTTRKEP